MPGRLSWIRKRSVAEASNLFELEWPPRSGKMQAFPEIDRAEFFSPEEAEKKINQSQRAFLDGCGNVSNKALSVQALWRAK